MSNDVILFNPNEQSQLPAHLMGADLNVNKDLLATVGAGSNRIGLKGNRFRLVLNGKEEAIIDENYLDVIVVGVVPNISRMFYAGTYDAETKTAPTCFSADGYAPPADLPGKQADKCETCPMLLCGTGAVTKVRKSGKQLMWLTFQRR